MADLRASFDDRRPDSVTVTNSAGESVTLTFDELYELALFGRDLLELARKGKPMMLTLNMNGEVDLWSREGERNGT